MTPMRSMVEPKPGKMFSSEKNKIPRQTQQSFLLETPFEPSKERTEVISFSEDIEKINEE